MDGQKIIDLLKPHISSAAQFSTSKAEGIGHQRWTTFEAPTFSATVKPANLQDLQAAVKYATASKIPFMVTSSGHGYGRILGKAKDVLEIDLRSFKDIKVDKEANTVTIGGSVLHRELIEPLFKAGKQMRISSCLNTTKIFNSCWYSFRCLHVY